jgi:uncharacterized membrane protein YfcA
MFQSQPVCSGRACVRVGYMEAMPPEPEPAPVLAPAPAPEPAASASADTAARAKAVLAASAAARAKASSGIKAPTVTGARPVHSSGAQRKQRLRGKGKKEGCTIGMDRDRRIVCRSGEKEFRIPRALVPALLVVLLLLLFVRSGTEGEHIASAEHVHSYSGSLDGAALTVLASTVSTLSGVAPGALFVPIFIAVEGLSPHDAIPLALATTLGGAAAVVVRDWTKPHPLHPQRKLIDFHAAALLAPPVAAGSVAGVYADKVLPPWMLTLLLTATLLFFTVKAAREGRDALAPLDPLAPPPVTAPAVDLEAAAAAAAAAGGAQEPGAAASEHSSLQRLAAVSAVLLGGTVLQAVAPCGGTIFWMGLALIFFVLAAVGGLHAQAAIATHATRVATNYGYMTGDVQWDETTTVNAAVKAVGGGVATGLLGLGTGPTTIPTVSLLGMLPVVSAPTTASVTAVASFGGCCQYMLVGLLGPGLVIWQAMLGFLGVVVGQQITAKKLLDLPTAAGLPPGGGGSVVGGRDAAQAQGRALLGGAVVVGVCTLLLMRHGLHEVSGHGLRGFRPICADKRFYHSEFVQSAVKAAGAAAGGGG